MCIKQLIKVIIQYNYTTKNIHLFQLLNFEIHLDIL